MRVKKRRAVTSTKATAQDSNRLSKSYRNCATKANENLKDQLGLLLWQLQSPLNKHQLRAGWSLLGVLLTQYITIRGETLSMLYAIDSAGDLRPSRSIPELGIASVFTNSGTPGLSDNSLNSMYHSITTLAYAGCISQCSRKLPDCLFAGSIA